MYNSTMILKKFLEILAYKAKLLSFWDQVSDFLKSKTFDILKCKEK